MSEQIVQISEENSSFSLSSVSNYQETPISSAARIAIYDDFLSAPRVININPQPIANFIEDISSQTYEYAQRAGGVIPYTVIREITENFIHASFKECTISILEKGNVIRFSDQGPGILKKDLVQKPGFTSATAEMKQYIRGVGSGFPIVREYLSFSNGSLLIEDNVNSGSVITIAIHPQSEEIKPVEEIQKSQTTTYSLTDRQKKIISLFNHESEIGPTEISQALDISVATAYRELIKLEEYQLIQTQTNSKKRILTSQGTSYL